MTYIKRAIENVLKKARTQSKIVLLTGARQVGKTTVIRETFPQYAYLTLDDENELMLAKTDPRLFFREREYPLIIDEVQYVPELFRTIKLIADRSAEKGQLFLTGSQTYSLLSSTTESLSGRVTV
ncbi:MAG TPA: AAA family ATPase, partial [Methanocorpusculum sp.]|nr:AAA family ATPase [Methanocorpusculum sp.]